MKDNKVTSVTLDEWLGNLRTQEWQVPLFQRDFVWSIDDCANFALSVLEGRPIGMVTIWEQPDDTDLVLGPICLYPGQQQPVEFGDPESRPTRYYAVLDGRQRSQAVAMAFGGLKSSDLRSKYAGSFVLDTREPDDTFKVAFLHDRELDRLGIRRETDFIAAGLFPLASDDPQEGMVSRWLRYVTAMNEPATYPGNLLPEPGTLQARKRTVQIAFDGLTRARLAVYTVPSMYQLGDICEIFETLNTTGTKVSTVDLIHSWLYSETRAMATPMLLRDWISEMGERDGAVGWASRDDRPELFVQLVAGCYLASADPPPPRRRARRIAAIKSIKASDLLDLPTAHWLAARESSPQLARYLGDFQKVAGDGSSAFPFTQTPYPVTAGIYVGLRWKLDHEPGSSRPWGTVHLDALFRAFFWQNALKGRYDQGFLTRFGTDLDFLQELLAAYTAATSLQEWCSDTEEKLAKHIGLPLPDETTLLDLLGDGKTAGARERALALPMRCRVKRDVLDSNMRIGYPEAPAELHHVFPTQWCKDNNCGSLRAFLDQNKERNPVSAMCNLMPLSRTSNSIWRTRNPAAIIQEHHLAFEQTPEVFRAAFIDEECFAMLQQGAQGVLDFWERRKTLMARDLLRRMHVTVVSE